MLSVLFQTKGDIFLKIQFVVAYLNWLSIGVYLSFALSHSVNIN